MRVLFLGTQSFPFGMAEVEKQTLIARSLHEHGFEAKFVCNKSFNFNSTLPFRGRINGINYIYTNLFSRRLKNRFINAIFCKLGIYLEILYLFFASFDFAILNSRSYSEINKYSTILHLRKKKIFLTLTEDLRSMHPNADKAMLKNIENFETKTWHKIDGVFPISEELIRQVKEKNPLLPLLKIPVLVDLKDLENAVTPTDIPKEGYLLFCGSSDYYETIDFIISGFERASQNLSLLLVVNGNSKSMNNVRDRILRSDAQSRIIVKSGLSKEALWGYYKYAKALLIPLNFDQRDKARFPHKIGEYCASGSIIITSEWGEIPHYFKDGINCLMLKTNKVEEFASKLDILNNNVSLQENLAQASYNLAAHEFNYQIFGKTIIDFLRNQLKKN